jgi:hypothetical protein
VVRPGRVAPSTTYDLQYRAVIVACAFDIHAAADALGLRRVGIAKLKLFQFVAVRPWLLPSLREWSAERRQRQGSLLAPARLRHGFLGDTMYDDVVRYLVARDAVTRIGNDLVSGHNAPVLAKLHSEVITNGLFEKEREVLHALTRVTITKRMLEGW